MGIASHCYSFDCHMIAVPFTRTVWLWWNVSVIWLCVCLVFIYRGVIDVINYVDNDILVVWFQKGQNGKKSKCRIKMVPAKRQTLVAIQTQFNACLEIIYWREKSGIRSCCTFHSRISEKLYVHMFPVNSAKSIKHFIKIWLVNTRSSRNNVRSFSAFFLPPFFFLAQFYIYMQFSWM